MAVRRELNARIPDKDPSKALNYYAPGICMTTY